jgi:hypothetical protein
MLQRIATRSTNPFGKAAHERQRIWTDLDAVEPLLRATSTVEIVTTIPITKVADALESVARRADGGSGVRFTRFDTCPKPTVSDPRRYSEIASAAMKILDTPAPATPRSRLNGDADSLDGGIRQTD